MSGLPVIRMRYRAHRARVSSVSSVYLLLPIAIALLLADSISGSIFSIVPGERVQAKPRASFVRLTPEQSEAAMASVRTSWQLERGGPVSVDFDPAVAAFRCATRPAGPVSVRRPKLPQSYGANIAEFSAMHPLSPPSMAAPPPTEIAEACAPTEAAELFPRADLLKFDGLVPSKKGK